MSKIVRTSQVAGLLFVSGPCFHWWLVTILKVFFSTGRENMFFIPYAAVGKWRQANISTIFLMSRAAPKVIWKTWSRKRLASHAIASLYCWQMDQMASLGKNWGDLKRFKLFSTKSLQTWLTNSCTWAQWGWLWWHQEPRVMRTQWWYEMISTTRLIEHADYSLVVEQPPASNPLL